MELQSNNNTNGAAPMPVTMAAVPQRNPLKPPVAGKMPSHDVNATVMYKRDPAKDFDHYCREVDLCWSKAIDGIVAMGFLMCEARMNLAPSEWRKLIDEHCPFDYTVACRLMQIAQDQRVTDPEIKRNLPPSWDKLYQLMKMEQDVFQHGLDSKIIHPKMSGKDITDLKDSWKKRKAAAASTAPVKVESETISDAKSIAADESEADVPDVADQSAAEPITEAAVKGAASTSGLRIVEKPAVTTAAATMPVTTPEKGRIKILLNREVMDQHREDVDRLKGSLERLVKTFPFVGSVELEVAA